MSKRNRKLEWLKNILIILLLVSALLLGWSSRILGNGAVRFVPALSDLYSRLTAGANGGGSSSDKPAEASRPIAILITNGQGAHFGAKYDTKDLSDIYGRTGSLFGEALSLPGEPAETDEADWRAALKSAGVYYEYLSPIKLSVLCAWFGAQADGSWGNMTARRMCFTDGTEGGRLYFQDAGTGLFYKAETEQLDSMEGLADSYGTNSAVFAFEVSGVELKDPYMLLMTDAVLHPELEAVNPLSNDSVRSQALAGLGVSEHLKPYTDEDGTLVYVESDATVSLTVNGTIVFRKSDKAAGSSAADEGKAVETAYRAVSGTIAKYCGADTSVVLDSVLLQNDGTWAARFVYMIAGGQVFLGQDGFAAQVIVGSEITEMELRFRSYSTVTGTEVPLLPEIQAAAAAAGGDFILSYTDEWSTVLDPLWAVRTEVTA